MSPEFIPQISLGTAALAIFAVCAGFILLRGVTRMIVGTAVLSLSAWVGFRVWQQAPTLSIEWTGKSLVWLTHSLPVVAFLFSLFLISKLANAIVRPFRKSPDKENPRSIIKLAFLLLLALIPTSLILMIAATLIHHNGSIAEVRAYSGKSIGSPETTPDSFSQKLKSSVESAIPARWLKALDPLAEPSRLALAKLIAAQAESPHELATDPQTGKPIPRAIIVNEPELQNLARDGNFGTLLRHPLLTKALADPKVKKLLNDLSL